MILTGQQISLKSAKLEGAIAQCLKDWAMAHPDELVSLDEHVRAIRQNASSRNVITNDGNMMLKAEIPVSLDAMLRKRFHQHWLVMPDLRNEVFAQFRVGMVNRNSVSWR